MFVESENCHYQPKINKTSQRLANGLAPLPSRVSYIAESHEARIARIAEEVEAVRKDSETFVPKINPQPCAATAGRVPLAEQSNVMMPCQKPTAPLPDPEATHKPVINTRAVTRGTREALELQKAVRETLRELWKKYCDDSSTMSSDRVTDVMSSIGLDGADDALRCKLTQALVGEDPNGYIHYNQFCRVLGALINSVAPSLEHQSPQPREVQHLTAPNNAKPRFLDLPRHRDPTAQPFQPTYEERQLQSCTFRPSINTTTSPPLATTHVPRPHSQPPPKSSEEMQAEECTFAPQILKSHSGASIPSSLAPPPPGFAKAVERMQTARVTAQPKFEDTLRGGAPSVSPPVAVACPPETKVKPFHLRSEERAKSRRGKPFLYVDVDLPGGKQGRIAIFHRDEAGEVAKNFARSYGLDYDMQIQLKGLLEEKISAAVRQSSRTVWL